MCKQLQIWWRWEPLSCKHFKVTGIGLHASGNCAQKDHLDLPVYVFLPASAKRFKDLTGNTRHKFFTELRANFVKQIRQHSTIRLNQKRMTKQYLCAQLFGYCYSFYNFMYHNFLAKLWETPWSPERKTLYLLGDWCETNQAIRPNIGTNDLHIN
jgi:hypothetical protein